MIAKSRVSVIRKFFFNFSRNFVRNPRQIFPRFFLVQPSLDANMSRCFPRKHDEPVVGKSGASWRHSPLRGSRWLQSCLFSIVARTSNINSTDWSTRWFPRWFRWSSETGSNNVVLHGECERIYPFLLYDLFRFVNSVIYEEDE